MEINIKQRIIGGAVLAALVIIFVPLLFKSPANKTKHQQLTLESSIPAAPVQPSKQTTITMQGEELNPQENATTVAATPANTMEQNLSAEKTTATSTASAPTPTTTAQSVPAVVTKTPDADLLEPASVPTPTKTKTLETTKPAVKTTTAKTIAHKETKKIPVMTAPAVAVTHKKIAPAKAWVVQLGSFGDAAKAKSLEKQLHAKGFTVFSHTNKTSIGTMTRVFVGPEIKREKADALKTKLEKQFHVQGIVVAFQPTQLSKAKKA